MSRNTAFFITSNASFIIFNKGLSIDQFKAPV